MVVFILMVPGKGLGLYDHSLPAHDLRGLSLNSLSSHHARSACTAGRSFRLLVPSGDGLNKKGPKGSFLLIIAEGDCDYKDGARGTKLSEPLVLDLTYPIQWHEPRVDLAELAKLRYLEGWSRQRLASHYGRTLNAITNYCQTIRRRDFRLPGLTETERKKIRWAYQN